MAPPAASGGSGGRVWRWAIGLVVGYAVVASLAWLLAGSILWTIGMVGGLLLLIVLWFTGIKEWTGALFGWQWQAVHARILLMLLYTTLVWSTWIYLGTVYAPATVHIDNASPRTVTLELNGQRWMQSQQGSMALASLRPGSYTLTVRTGAENDPQEQISVVIEPGRTYILNVLRAQKYRRGSVAYGIAIPRDGLEAKEIDDAWFEAKVDYLFQEPPKKMEVSKQTFTLSKSYLLRASALSP